MHARGRHRAIYLVLKFRHFYLEKLVQIMFLGVFGREEFIFDGILVLESTVEGAAVQFFGKSLQNYPRSRIRGFSGTRNLFLMLF